MQTQAQRNLAAFAAAIKAAAENFNSATIMHGNQGVTRGAGGPTESENESYAAAWAPIYEAYDQLTAVCAAAGVSVEEIWC